jgi:hypothetical protein
MKTSFIEILSKDNIVIPIIQRDYAQGRTDTKTIRIRKDFLDAIFEVLQERINSGFAKSLELDFIYGFSTSLENKTTFAPIDGQQRLTTLWLLLWYITAKEKVSNEQKQLLANFKYETRHSTTMFCDELIHFAPVFKNSSIDEEIKNQPWYIEAWDYDPSIKAMLVMLKDIENRYCELSSTNAWDIFNHAENPFYFYKLDMEKVGLPDDLYIKMNSRGKPLTEFEYFKAGFLEVIKNKDLKKRFEAAIDQKWAECIWTIVLEKVKDKSNIDIALLVDDCFIRLINYISDVLAYKQGLPFIEINHSIEDTKGIYQKEENLIFLFDVLDSITELQNNNPDFWNSLFYVAKDEFASEKSRLFFQNTQINLLGKCLFNYDKKSKGFSYSEQLLLFACITHLLNKTSHFNRAARIVRNLVANSESELRDATIGLSFSEIEAFVQSFDFSILNHFKTDQIKEEEEKYSYITQHTNVTEHVSQLEDSDILRGSISIFDLDEKFVPRKIVFLNLFDEDVIQSDFVNRSNVLLCFGDYSQDDGPSNLLARAKGNWRSFLTTPAINKPQLTSRTKVVLMDCLDFFHTNPSISIDTKIAETLAGYQDSTKDWKYYFLKYPGFRHGSNKGYYYWDNVNPYPLFKMKEKQFNGFHWDPFLLEIKNAINNKSINLGNDGGGMQITLGDDLLQIKSNEKGFIVENKNDASANNTIFDKLAIDKIITNEGLFEISQNSKNIDMEDRIEKGIILIKSIMNNSD